MNSYLKYGISLVAIIAISVGVIVSKSAQPNTAYLNSEFGYELSIPQGWSIPKEFSACSNEELYTTDGIAPCQDIKKTQSVTSGWNQATSKVIILSDATKTDNDIFLQKVRDRRATTLDYPYPYIYITQDTSSSTLAEEVSQMNNGIAAKGSEFTTKKGYPAALLTQRLEGGGFQLIVLIQNQTKKNTRLILSSVNESSTTDILMSIADSISFK